MISFKGIEIQVKFDEMSCYLMISDIVRLIKKYELSDFRLWYVSIRSSQYQTLDFDFIINEMIIYFHDIFEEVSWTYSEVNEES